MINLLKRFYPIIILIATPLIFFYPIFKGYILFPGEDVLNEFYPWKDQPAFHNNLPLSVHRFYGADPVIAHFPWKFIGIEMLKQGEWPLWNTYSFLGEPLLANSQSALFYPLNIVYFLFDFVTAWNIITASQVILAGIFLYLFLREYQLSKIASLWGGFIYAWNGFIANFFHIQVIGHTLIWLPFILFTLKKLEKSLSLKWKMLLLFSLSSMFLAGFLQIAFYSLLIIITFSWFVCRKSFKTLLWVLFLSLILTSIQLLPTLEYLSKSEREARSFYDRNAFLLSHLQLIRFLMPRFFGHPNSNNWWGGAMSTDHSYFGVLGFIFSLLGLVYMIKARQFRYWIILIIGGLIFIVNSPWTRFFYSLPIPLFNSITPSRGLGILLLPLAIFSALGLDQFFKQKQMFKSYLKIILLAVFLFQTADLLRENKFFTSVYTNKQDLYPKQGLIKFLEGNPQYRFLSTSIWIFPPNLSAIYHLNSAGTYDAIHLKNTVDFAKNIFIEVPQDHDFDFRAIWFSNLNQNMLDLLSIKYILSLQPLENAGLNYISKINSVYIYENEHVLPGAFLMSKNGSVQLIKQSPGSFEWKVTTDKTQKMFVSQNYDQGWNALIDGKASLINPVQSIFLSIEIPPGTHKVRLIYYPNSFKYGLYLSLAGILVYLILIFRSIFRSIVKINFSKYSFLNLHFKNRL